MPRCFLHIVSTALAALMALLLWSPAAVAFQGQDAADQALTGRLAFVEPALARITVLPDDAVHLFELFVDENSELRQGDRVLTLSDLVIEVGRRLTVRYRVDDDRRIVVSILLEPTG